MLSFTTTYMNMLNKNLEYHFVLSFIIIKVVIYKFIRRYFKLSLIMVDVANLDTKLENYFKLSFIMTNLVNLDAEC